MDIIPAVSDTKATTSPSVLPSVPILSQAYFGSDKHKCAHESNTFKALQHMITSVLELLLLIPRYWPTSKNGGPEGRSGWRRRFKKKKTWRTYVTMRSTRKWAQNGTMPTTFMILCAYWKIILIYGHLWLDAFGKNSITGNVSWQSKRALIKVRAQRSVVTARSKLNAILAKSRGYEKLSTCI